MVISSAAYQRDRPDVILLAITGQIRPQLGFGEALVADWRSAGLLKPSVFKPILFTVERSLLRKALGTLMGADRQTLRDVLRRILG